MPGIAGYGQGGADRKQSDNERLARMAEPMRYNSRQSVTHAETERCAVAVVEYGQGFEFQKSGLARRDGVTVIMDGEVFPDLAEVPPELRDGGAEVQRAEYCLHRYLEQGVSFIADLNGVFGIAVIDDRTGEVHVANDRFGHNLMFLWARADECAFASSMRSILALGGGIGNAYDPKAVAELMVFERLLADRTLYSDIKRLPAGCRATWKGNGWQVARYFSAKRRKADPNLKSWRDGADELVRRLSRSIDKRTSDSGAVGLFLSGGLDSRLVLGCATRPMVGLTFSHPGMVAREASVAARIAEVAGVPLIMLEREEGYYAEIAPLASELNEGIATFVGSHSVGVHPQMADAGVRVAMTGDRSDVAFKDYFATCISRDGLDPWTGSQQQVDLSAKRLMESGMIRKPEHQRLMIEALSPALRSDFNKVHEETEEWLRGLLSSGNSLEETLSELALCDWQAQTSLAMVRGLATEFVERSPFFDNAVWDLAMELPIDWRADARIVKKAIVLASPAMGRIEDVSTRIAPCVPAKVAKVGEQLKELAKWGRRALQKPAKGGDSESAKPASVFSWSGFHDRNAALLKSEAYRKLVQNTVAGLPDDYFNRSEIEAKLTEDLKSSVPTCGKLFEILITFSEFSKDWGSGRDTATKLETIRLERK